MTRSLRSSVRRSLPAVLVAALLALAVQAPSLVPSTAGAVRATVADPVLVSFDVTVAGTMPDRVRQVRIGSQQFATNHGAYQATIPLAAGVRHAVLVVQGLDAADQVVVVRNVQVDLDGIVESSN